jgi:hypothetical protein
MARKISPDTKFARQVVNATAVSHIDPTRPRGIPISIRNCSRSLCAKKPPVYISVRTCP